MSRGISEIHSCTTACDCHVQNASPSAASLLSQLRLYNETHDRVPTSVVKNWLGHHTSDGTCPTSSRNSQVRDRTLFGHDTGCGRSAPTA